MAKNQKDDGKKNDKNKKGDDKKDEAGAGQEDQNNEGLNDPVEGLTADELAGGQAGAPKVAEEVEVAPIPEGKRAILDSPRNFGIWVNGKRHSFKKGKTPLTEEQHEACQKDGYVKDNGAEILYK